MTVPDVRQATGVNDIRTVSGCTNVIEFRDGSARPATELEILLWKLLTNSPVTGRITLEWQE